MIDFKAPYKRETALSFLSRFLPEDFQKIIEEKISLNFKPFCVERVNKLGEVSSLQDLHIFEIVHESENDPRVGLSKDAFRLLANFGVRKALVFFVSKKSPNYRLSLITLDFQWESGKKVEREYSNPRRYSFFLGPDAKTHTPAEFLGKKDAVKDIEDLVSRFDVEVVTKEFFQKYKALFESLQKFLDKDHAFTAFSEKNAIDVDAFAKKILGQIVFCYFLQKKGWLGAKKGEDINKGDKDFIRSLFARSAEKKENFYNEYLEPLFYDSLNASPEEPGDFYREYFGSQIPFLNGGLFEPLENYDWKKSFLHIPDTLFSSKKGDGILDVFDLYNFTVYEDDPVDREVSVDPEMLGKVFENLLPENIRKGQGAYYTPREIVHYMCQESLINHLITETKIEEKNIRMLITSKEHLFTSGEGLVFSPAEAEKLDNVLADIKVCDPACGSGAFLVGMLHEIVMARRVLNPKKHEHRLKKEAIQNSIYGVDIDPGATEIAKLRLWLSLMVDYKLEDIEPLPNLDYKIMCGNSLAGIEKNLFNEGLLADLEKTKILFFNEAKRKTKETLRKRISTLFKQIVFECKDFDFEVYFSEVFHNKKGFDVIIANPPYIGESGHKELFRQTKKGPLGQFYLGKMDYFYFFLHLAINLARPNGQIAFITTNYYLTASGGKKLREDFKNRATIRALINFNELKIFESAKGQHNMITLLEKDRKEDAITRTCVTKRVGPATPEVLLRILSWGDEESACFTILQENLYDGAENYIRLNRTAVAMAKGGSANINQVLDRIAEQGERLDKIANIDQGVVSGCDYVSNRNINKLSKRDQIELGDGIFVFDSTNSRDSSALAMFTRNEKTLLKRFFKNSDIQKYWCSNCATKQLLYIGRERTSLEAFPAAIEHLKKFKAILCDRREVQNGRMRYFQLQWPRTESLFTGEKIVVPYRSATNSFAYNSSEWFCRSDCYLITQKDPVFNLKYLLALLNSTLYFHWLYHRGKRKGEVLELFQIPLSEIPIKKISKTEQKPFVAIVDEILSMTQSPHYLDDVSMQAKVKECMHQIDQMVYKLYELADDGIKVVEESTAEHND